MHGKTDDRIGHLAGIALLTLVLLWPALWFGAPPTFFDTENYYNGGGEAVEFFLDRTGLNALFDPKPSGESLAGSSPGQGAREAGAPPNSVRSVPYSVFLNIAFRAIGPMGAVVPMALVTAWLIWLMMAPVRPTLRFAAGLVTAVFTTMPFYAAQTMPDIQAAWLIAIPIIVMQRGGVLGRPLAAGLFLAATAAILVHYSHIPLAAATGVVLGLWFLRSRRYGAAIVAQLPLVIAVALNLAISVVIAQSGGGGPAPSEGAAPAAKPASSLSIAPGRLPILLGRLLEDGVAIRYLSETCPENGFTICRVYDQFPETSRAVLWGPNHIRRAATPDQMQRISAEESSLAWHVLLYDPWAQIRASTGNTIDQVFRVGFSEMRLADYEILGPAEIDLNMTNPPPRLLAALDGIQAAALTLAALALLVFAWRMPAARAPIVLLVLGLLANAFVCGALSAPAGRYQGRVVWVVVATAMAFGLSWRESRRTGADLPASAAGPGDPGGTRRRPA